MSVQKPKSCCWWLLVGNELKQQPEKAKCPEVVVKVLVVLICLLFDEKKTFHETIICDFLQSLIAPSQKAQYCI